MSACALCPSCGRAVSGSALGRQLSFELEDVVPKMADDADGVRCLHCGCVTSRAWLEALSCWRFLAGWHEQLGTNKRLRLRAHRFFATLRNAATHTALANSACHIIDSWRDYSAQALDWIGQHAQPDAWSALRRHAAMTVRLERALGLEGEPHLPDCTACGGPMLPHALSGGHCVACGERRPLC